MRVLAIDQGTTSTRAILVDGRGRVIGEAQRAFKQHYPKPGWVEHDPLEIWRTVVDTVKAVCAKHPGPVAAVGITNQRETTVVWDRRTGKPVYNAIVWQCRRTTDACRALQAHAPLFRRRTGLPLDAYFSGTKIRWILDHVQPKNPARLACGTIDSWLIWNLTGGQTHATDYTNASRTLLFNIHKRRWDPNLCNLLGVPPSLLPHVKSSIDDYGLVTGIPALKGVPIFGVAGDQQAALFGQTCFSRGQSKSTYGTGAFLLMHTGKKAVTSKRGLITTLTAQPDGSCGYALEGSVFIAGAAIQWLRDELKIISRSADSEAAARALSDNGGVYLVPAFVGLGAPHWDMDARGTIVGLTRGTNRKHLIRAALESIAFQVADVLDAMQADTRTKLPRLAVDGGAVQNDFLMQFQADMLGVPVQRPANVESTALGAAYLAGLKAGVWQNGNALAAQKRAGRTFKPTMKPAERQRLRAGWQHAIRQTRTP
ncbi:MAG: glycerol kinase GlpK [Verrucomicrobia bacterium]|nr:glycerol kinase GlpK [Verrucomicrobiota bacterium]